jgi:hypothetical protein
VGDTFSGEHVRLAQGIDDTWDVWLGPLKLGVIDLARPRLNLIY